MDHLQNKQQFQVNILLATPRPDLWPPAPFHTDPLILFRKNKLKSISHVWFVTYRKLLLVKLCMHMEANQLTVKWWNGNMIKWYLKEWSWILPFPTCRRNEKLFKVAASWNNGEFKLAGSNCSTFSLISNRQESMNTLVFFFLPTLWSAQNLWAQACNWLNWNKKKNTFKGILRKNNFDPNHELVFALHCSDLKLKILWLFYFSSVFLGFKISRVLPCLFFQTLMGNNYDVIARFRVFKIQHCVNTELKIFF